MYSLQKTVSKSFTLIELLVVIAIIGLLASTVFASLGSARNKAKDAVIMSQVREFSKLMQLEYMETNSYANLQHGWVYTGYSSCNSIYAGTYATQARALCNKIIESNVGAGIYTGNALDNTNRFSIMAYLPGKATWFCIGSSGATSDLMGSSGHTTYWQEPGCYNQP